MVMLVGCIENKHASHWMFLANTLAQDALVSFSFLSLSLSLSQPQQGLFSSANTRIKFSYILHLSSSVWLRKLPYSDAVICN